MNGNMKARDIASPGAQGAQELQPQRWRDAPENQALVKQAIGSGALDEGGAERVMAFHEKNGSNPTGVFQSFIRSAGHAGQPATDTSKVKPNPLDAHEADIVDRLLGGELKTVKVV